MQTCLTHDARIRLRNVLAYFTHHSPVRLRRVLVVCWLLCFLQATVQAQVSPPVPATTSGHHKQVIGYITQWDAWKEVANLVPKGGYNQLNVDYSQYTILNFSFFGVAQDGSLHSGDFRNQNIYQAGAVQAPAPLVNTDIYSSWDMYLLYGELETLYYISDGSNAYNQGYRNDGSGWKNVNTGATGAFPLSVHKDGGAPGVIDLAHQKGVKVMASVGGWSMCKHYPEVAADPAKRAAFIASCQTLMGMGFDGIDFDWEYPNDPGMNIEHYSAADFSNFALLVEQVRSAIGSSKLITACFSAAPAKLTGFDWGRLNNSMNYFNLMTYDYNGGWSNKAGHNAPLYDYPGAEYANFSVNATVQAVKTLGVNLSKVNIGAGFYGRGVVTTGPAALNGVTTKRSETIQPDGPVQTCADYTNWSYWTGTPNYSYIQQATTTGWTEYWDDVAKVPYKTNGNYFLSYDNERSIGLKAQYVKDNSLAGIIVWQVYGDMTNMTANTVAKSKLIYCPSTTSPLVNKINAVFADGTATNTPPTVSLTAPANGASYTAPASITITATAGDADGAVAKVEFYNGATLLGAVTTSPYTYTWSSVPNGTYLLTAKATDNGGAFTSSSVVTIVVGSSTGTGCNGIAAWSATAVYTGGNQVVYNNKIYQAKWWTQNEQPDINTGDGKSWAYVADCTGGATNTPPVVSLTNPSNGAAFTAPAAITITATASDADGSIAKVDFYNGSTLLGTVTASPYSYAWSNVPGGAYSLTAKATDNGGAATTSAPVSVTVTGGAGGTANCAGVAAYQLYPAVYNNGDLVVYNGVLYQSLSDALYNVTPGTADWWWKPLGTCSSATAVTASATAGKSLQLTTETSVTYSVYPNPVSGNTLQIALNAKEGERLRIELLDISGHNPIRKKKYTAGLQGQQLLTLDISGVPAGIWILKITHTESGETSITKIIRL